MNNKTEAVKNRVRKWVSMSGRDAELPVTDSFLLEMADDGVLHIRGCRGIVDYTPELIALATDRFLLRVKGGGLYFMQYSGAEAAVGGAIGAVEFGR